VKVDSAQLRQRRVGVTARSRRTGTRQATGASQVASEMAAPLASRTPMGTAAKAANRVRMEAWRQGRRLRSDHPTPGRAGQRRQSRALRAHEALPHTPPGGKPPETPGPLSLDHRFYARGRIRQGFATPAPSAALDRFAPLRTRSPRRGKGGLRQCPPRPASRWSASQVRPLFRPGRRALRAMRRCLMLRQGGEPP
jgi:hypothetical protein